MTELSASSASLIDTPDENFSRLTRVQWSGIRTQKVLWGREGNDALATLRSYDDALQFAGSLQFWDAFKTLDTSETERLRGVLADEYLPRKSTHDQIQFPERSKAGLVPEETITIRIPLNIINASGLQEFLDGQARADVKPQTCGKAGNQPKQ